MILRLLEEIGGLVEVDELRYQLERRGERLHEGAVTRLLKNDAIRRVNGGYIINPKRERGISDERPDVPL